MCGIAGVWRFGGALPADAQAAARMGLALAHRGPDDHGLWSDAEAGVHLVHRRLSIVDLSPLGHQPMASASGRYVIVFNGEVYNFGAIRDELTSLGHAFRGSSDTEVLLAAIEQWGIERTLVKSNGMLAFALWDRRDRVLTLARDRFGEKPLYFGAFAGALVFGSELKALRAHPACGAKVSRAALQDYLRFGYVPAPASILEGVHKVPVGSFVQFSASGDARTTTYWSLGGDVESGQRAPFRGSIEDATDELERLLKLSVKLRMVSDVPLGAFLSGGIDSSTVVALMQTQSPRPVKTFTIGFHEAAFNEAHAARRVAAHLGTDHTELYVTPKEAREVIPKISSLYDEPFADSSQIPTYLVSALARQHVTVALSGDAGDELFGGYSRYFFARKLWSLLHRTPEGAKHVAADMAARLPIAGWGKVRRTTERIRRWGGLLSTPSDRALYTHLATTWRTADAPLAAGTLSDAPLAHDHPSLGSFEEWMMYADSMSYLPDDILVKVDRAAMGVSLEARVPMLDPNVSRFAWSLPVAMRFGSQGKEPLRRVLARHVPRALFERPKMGFGVPVGAWLRGPLHDWAEDLLDERRLEREGIFNPKVIRKRWREHVSGQHDWQYALWFILTFQAWLDAWPGTEL